MRIIRITAQDQPHPVSPDEWPVVVILPKDMEVTTLWPYYLLNTVGLFIHDKEVISSNTIILSAMEVDDNGIVEVLKRGDHNIVIRWRYNYFRLWVELNEAN